MGIDATEGFQALARTFFDSAEYNLPPGNTDEQFGTDLYEVFLNRAPDLTGLVFWLGRLAQGLTNGMLVTQFANSAEFILFLESQLGATVTRPEPNLVNDFYRRFLAGLSDSTGFNAWLSQMRAAQCTGAQAVIDLSDQIALSFIGSPEYVLRARDNAGFVRDLYNGILRRGADIAGFNAWIAELAAGVPRDQILLAFTDSSEFQLRVTEVINAGCQP